MRVGELEVLPVWDGRGSGSPGIRGREHRAGLGVASSVSRSGRSPADRARRLSGPRGRQHRPHRRGDGADHGRAVRGRWVPGSLAVHRVEPAEINDPVFTHPHFDHVGWASLDGKPSFPTRGCAALRWTGTTSSAPTRGSPKGWNLSAIESSPAKTVRSSCRGSTSVHPRATLREAPSSSCRLVSNP
jgi:hypothetical protein